LIADAVLTDAGVEKAPETLLYVIWAQVNGAIVPWIIPAKDSYYRDVLFEAAVVNTIGFWFIGGFLGAALGWLLAKKGTGGRADGFKSGNTLNDDVAT
jgi:hypothetical protein